MKDVKEYLVKSSKAIGLEVTELANGSESFFDELLSLALSDQEPFNWRASWGILYFSEKYPEKIQPHLRAIAEKLPELSSHTQIASLLRLFDKIQFDLEEFGDLLDYCIHVIRIPQPREYIKVIAINMLIKFCKKNTELKPEIIQQIEMAQPSFEMKNLKKMSKKVLEQLKESH